VTTEGEPVSVSPEDDDESVGFFDRESSLNAATHFQASESITLFVGAGVSLAQGSPSWRRLVELLLRERLDDDLSRQFNDEQQEQVLGGLVDYLDVLGGASAAQQLFDVAYPQASRAHLFNRLFDHLYHDWIAANGLGAAIARLALLAKASGTDVHVITTNYDDNIETAPMNSKELKATYVALEETLDEVPVFQTFSERPPELPANVIPVVHIHGAIPQNGPTDPNEGVVFSERDYALFFGEQPEGLDTYLVERFGESDVLFVGTSLRDPNIIECLVRSRETAEAEHRLRLTVAPVADEFHFCQRNGVPTPAVKVMADVAASRLRHLGIIRLRPDFYGQVTQFIHEMSLAMSSETPGDYVNRRYSLRLRNWWDRWSADWSEPDIQPKIQGSLADLVNKTQDRLRASGNDQVSRIKAELWVREDPDRRIFTLWGSSESHLQHPSHRATIALETSYFPIQAFASRSAEFRTIPYDVSYNWRFFMAVPIILSNEPWQELPVGVVTLLFRSDDGAEDAHMSSTPIQVIDALVRSADDTGQELLGVESDVAVGESATGA
jgi:NAD-dependent SIR2 family protein deacetylase